MRDGAECVDVEVCNLRECTFSTKRFNKLPITIGSVADADVQVAGGLVELSLSHSFKFVVCSLGHVVTVDGVPLNAGEKVHVFDQSRFVLGDHRIRLTLPTMVLLSNFDVGDSTVLRDFPASVRFSSTGAVTVLHPGDEQAHFEFDFDESGHLSINCLRTAHLDGVPIPRYTNYRVVKTAELCFRGTTCQISLPTSNPAPSPVKPKAAAPKNILPITFPLHLMGDCLVIVDFVSRFGPLLKLAPFSLEQLFYSLQVEHMENNGLVSQVHCSLLRALLSSPESSEPLDEDSDYERNCWNARLVLQDLVTPVSWPEILRKVVTKSISDSLAGCRPWVDFPDLEKVKAAAEQLGRMEYYQLSFQGKVLLLRFLCDETAGCELIWSQLSVTAEVPEPKQEWRHFADSKRRYTVVGGQPVAETTAVNAAADQNPPRSAYLGPQEEEEPSRWLHGYSAEGELWWYCGKRVDLRKVFAPSQVIFDLGDSGSDSDSDSDDGEDEGPNKEEWRDLTRQAGLTLLVLRYTPASWTNTFCSTAKKPRGRSNAKGLDVKFSVGREVDRAREALLAAEKNLPWEDGFSWPEKTQAAWRKLVSCATTISELVPLLHRLEQAVLDLDPRVPTAQEVERDTKSGLWGVGSERLRWLADSSQATTLSALFLYTLMLFNLSTDFLQKLWNDELSESEEDSDAYVSLKPTPAKPTSAKRKPAAKSPASLPRGKRQRAPRGGYIESEEEDDEEEEEEESDEAEEFVPKRPARSCRKTPSRRAATRAATTRTSSRAGSTNKTRSARVQSPDPQEAEPEEYEVERILSEKHVDGNPFFLVKWLGYEETTWEPLEHLCGNVLLEQWQKDQCRDLVPGGASVKATPALVPIGKAPESKDLCSVCGDGECEDDNEIVFCDGCDVAVHQACYGVPEIPKEDWLCAVCVAAQAQGVDLSEVDAQCFACPLTGGARKPTRDAQWVHVACAMWIPELGFGDTVFMAPITGSVPAARTRLKCGVCKQAGGAPIQCNEGACLSAFHVLCARSAGFMVVLDEKEGAVGFCAKHSDAKRLSKAKAQTKKKKSARTR